MDRGKPPVLNGFYPGMSFDNNPSNVGNSIF
jgi:hypothetical protein